MFTEIAARRPAIETIDHILELLSQEHGLDLSPVERSQDGEQGAYEVVDATGERLVLKVAPGVSLAAGVRRSEEMLERLHQRDVPVPRYRWILTTDGNTVSLQERLPGQPMGRLNPSYLPQLLDLIERQRHAAVEESENWPNSIVESVLIGGDGYCVVESLRDYSADSAALLVFLQSTVRDADYSGASRSDTVHFDFNPLNILVEDGVVTGVVDWDGIQAGDRGFDLVTLFYYAHGDPQLRRQIFSAAAKVSSFELINLYLAHMIVRQLDWSIRHHSAEVARYWLQVGEKLAREIIGR